MQTRLIILGSGTSIGSPRIDGFWGKCNKKNRKNIRTRCSAIIIKGSNSVLIDTSPDIKNQLISNKIKNINSVIFTHEHADQTSGLFELKPFFWKNKKKIDIYGSQKTVNLLKKRYDYCFNDVKGYPAIVKSNVVKNKFNIGKSNEKIYFKTLQVKHGLIKNTAYIFEKTAYINDCKDLSIVNMKELKNLKLLIIDCFKYVEHPTHFSLDESLFVHSSLKPERTILTNIHQDLDYRILMKKLPKNVKPAFDGLKINI